MGQIILTQDQVQYLNDLYPSLAYNEPENTISGVLRFNLIWPDHNGTQIEDEYSIEIILNELLEEVVPKVRETKGRILAIAVKKGITGADMHLYDITGSMCIIIPPKIKEKYPNGFDLKIFLHHLQEHFYWISHFDRFNIKPWPDYGHSDLGYLQLYLEDEEKYKNEVKAYLKSPSRQVFRKTIRELRKKYKI